MLPPLVRDRVSRRLDEASGVPVVLVWGIAGAGKSTAVRHWLATCPVRHAVLRLDERDDDPTRFWSRVGIALGAHAPTDGGALDRVDALLEALDQGEPGVLVLDDLHALSNPTLHESLGYFADRMPAHVQLVIASRSPLPATFARMASEGRVRTIGGAVLAFTPAEVAELLGRAVDDDLVRHVSASTGGWAIAVALARGAVEEHPDRAGHAADPVAGAVAQRDATAFLAREVTRALPDELRDAALDLAVLDELTPALVADVLGIDDPAHRLAMLADRGVLVEADGEFTMHPVVRDALRAHLDRRAPERARQLSLRASRFCEAHDVAAAISYALAAEDSERAAELIERHRTELQEVRYAVQLRWFMSLPESVVRTRSALRAHGVTVASYERRPDLVARWMRDRDSADARSTEDLGALTVHLIRVGDLPKLAEVAGRLHERIDDAHPLWRLSCGALTGALVATGNRERALAVISAMFRAVNAQPVQFLPLQSTGRAVGVVLLAESGRVEQARIALGMLREWVAEAASIDGYSDLGAVDWAASRLALAAGDRQAAASWRTVPAAEAAFGLPFLEAWLAIDFAEARLADADEDAARSSLHRAQSLLARFVDPAAFGDRLRAVGAPLGIAPFARTAAREPVVELSERELSVLQLLDSALSAREIAAHLFVSPNTLKSHVRAVYRKLGVNSRHSAVRAARECGLIHPVG